MPDNQSSGALKFHYIKGNSFRVIHADGAIGGITPNRGVFLSLFSERGAIPKLIEVAINADGSLGEEVARRAKDGIVREVEIGVVLDARAAKGIADWLYSQVEILNAREPKTDLETSTNPVKMT
jgi:hypothetical protein